MADHTVTTHRRALLIAGGGMLAGLGLAALAPVALAPDPAVAAYRRLRTALAAYEDYDGDFGAAVYHDLQDEAHAAE